MASKSSERAATMTSAISRMSSSTKPRVVRAGVPMRRPEGFIGGRSSKGIALRLTVIADLVQAAPRRSARRAERGQVDEHQVDVGAAGEDRRCRRPQAVGERLRVGDRLPLVGAERLARGDLEARPPWPAIMCISGPPCWPGKTALSIAFAYSSRQRIMPLRGPRSVLWIVVVTTSASGPGWGAAPAATSPAKCAISTISWRRPRRRSRGRRRIDLPRVGGRAGDDQLGLVLLGEPRDLVDVDPLVLAADAVRWTGCRAGRRS